VAPSLLNSLIDAGAVEPKLYANGTLVTEHHVREALSMLGDETVKDYEAGHISKSEAYEMTRRRLLQLDEFRQLARRR
jgi:hypothetical protein